MKSLRAGLAEASAVFLMVAACGPAVAGSAGGPYIVWFNLGTRAPDVADERIRAFVDGNDPLCWGSESLLYMRKRPPGLTPALVRKAVLDRDAKATRRVQAILHRPFDSLPAFDGLIVYSDSGQPRLSSLAITGTRKSETLLSPTGEMAWGGTFCRVLPPIGHPP